MTDNVIDLGAYTAGEAVGAPVPLLSLAQLREQAKTVPWLVKHVVPAESIGMLYGGSGTFKSFIAIDLALHIAHGLPWLGRKTRQGTVLIVAAEGGSGLWRRIVAWHRVRHLKWDAAPVFVVPVSVDLVADASRVTEAAAAANVKPELVVVDTMSQTFSGEENSAAEVSKYLREIGVWFRATWQATVLIVHHTGHKETERARGSSAIRANVDFMYSVFRDEKEMLATVECVKQKDGELPDPMSFSLQVIDLAKDEDGDPITSLVASGLDDQGKVLNAMAYEASRGRGGRHQLFLEIAQNGMEEKKVRQAFYDAVEGDADTKRQSYFRSRKWAMTAGLIEIAEGFVLRHGA